MFMFMLPLLPTTQELILISVTVSIKSPLLNKAIFWKSIFQKSIFTRQRAFLFSYCVTQQVKYLKINILKISFFLILLRTILFPSTNSQHICDTVVNNLNAMIGEQINPMVVQQYTIICLLFIFLASTQRVCMCNPYTIVNEVFD